MRCKCNNLMLNTGMYTELSEWEHYYCGHCGRYCVKTTSYFSQVTDEKYEQPKVSYKWHEHKALREESDDKN